MNVVIPISLLSLFLAYLYSTGKQKRGLKYCFFLLALVGAIHYDYGSDYMVYVAMFEESKELAFSWSSISEYFRDPGWITLCVIFRPLGFFSLVIFLNIIQNYIYYHIINKYVPLKWQWLSVYIYVFSTSYYLLNFSMMRQGIAIAIIFLAVFLLLERKYWKAVPLFVAASLIHGTSMIAIPFVLIVIFARNGRTVLTLYGAVFLLLLVFYRPIYSWLTSIAIDNNTLSEYNEMYKTGVGINLGIGFLIDIVTLVVIIYVATIKKCLSREESKIITFYVVGYLLLPFQMENQMVGRIGYYFNAMSIVMVPLTYRYLNKDIRTLLLGLFMAITAYRYWLFFTTGTFVYSYAKPFQTIFSVPWM